MLVLVVVDVVLVVVNSLFILVLVFVCLGGGCVSFVGFICGDIGVDDIGYGGGGVGGCGDGDIGVSGGGVVCSCGVCFGGDNVVLLFCWWLLLL